MGYQAHVEIIYGTLSDEKRVNELLKNENLVLKSKDITDSMGYPEGVELMVYGSNFDKSFECTTKFIVDMLLKYDIYEFRLYHSY